MVSAGERRWGYVAFTCVAAAAFIGVGAYTVAAKLPGGRLADDWLHTALHLATGSVAAVAVYRGSKLLAALLTAAVAVGYGALAAAGPLVDGFFLGTAAAVPLATPDHVFHGLLAAGALAALVAEGTAPVRRLIALVAATAGIGIVALPDSGPRLFSLSAAHGPSRVDALGVMLLVIGWLVLLASAPSAGGAQWVRSHRGSIGFAVGCGAGLLVASILSGFAWWWLVGAVLLACVQVAAAVAMHARR